MEVWNNFLKVHDPDNTFLENVTSDQEKTKDPQQTTDINRNPTSHLLSPYFNLGDLGDQEFADASLNGQREKQSVGDKSNMPSSFSDKNVDDLYTSER